MPGRMEAPPVADRCRGAPGASGRPPRRPCHPRGRSGGSLLTQLNKVLLEYL